MADRNEGKHVRRLRVVVLLSGSGRTLENFIRANDEGRIAVDFARVISSRSKVRGVEVADRAGIPLSIIPRRQFETVEAFSDAVHEVLDPEQPDLVLMAGFLSKIAIPPAFERPRDEHSSRALAAIRRAGQLRSNVSTSECSKSGMKISGCTVHFVDEHYDAGPIILQSCVPVLEDDDAARSEHASSPRSASCIREAIRLFAEDRLRIEGQRVQILPARLISSTSDVACVAVANHT